MLRPVSTASYPSALALARRWIASGAVRDAARRGGIAFALVFLLCCTAAAQSSAGHDTTEQISFDRPEAWALKYFASSTLLSGLSTPDARAPGSVAVGLELGWLPSLSVAQRTVGFEGTKTEDLNKAPVLPRVRVVVGLPGRFTFVAAFVPPVRAFGLEPRLLALALERPVYEATGWTVRLRGQGQVGHITGAYTCPQSVLAFAPGSPSNAYGCQAESSDTASLRFVGGELGVAHQHPGASGFAGKISPHAAIGVNYLNVAFQVNAETFDFLDRTHLLSHGVTFSASGGVGYSLSSRLSAAIDVFYTPLSVQRGAGASVNDGLFNVRALVTYRVR